MGLRNPSNGETLDSEVSSNCSTPYVSAPSSPTRNPNHSYFSAPASPMHYILTSSAATSSTSTEILHPAPSFEFDGPNFPNSMISADEIFLNGQIRPQIVVEDGETNVRGRDVIKLRSGSVHRRARSMSPIRNTNLEADHVSDTKEEENQETVASSRSSSSGRNSNRWIFIKDLLYRSKSEGSGTRNNRKEKEKEKEIKFWHFGNNKRENGNGDGIRVPIKKSDRVSNKKESGGNKKAMASAHERHYNMNRAQAEEMRRRTPLPYRQGTLFGCLGFSSRSYGAVSGFARTVNPVSSR